MGTGYVMRRIVAEVSPATILAAPPPSLLGDLGRELARIHALPRTAIPDGIPVMDAGAALAELKTRFVSYGGDRPAIALAIRWCEDHLPAPTDRSEEHTSELQSLMRISYAVFCLKKKKQNKAIHNTLQRK